MHTREINFNVRFDTATRDDLDKIADVWRVSRAEAIRRMVQNTAEHIFTEVPKCADGGRCFVPQMHAKKAV